MHSTFCSSNIEKKMKLVLKLSFLIFLVGPTRPTCPEGMFTCSNNQCIPSVRRCDNRQDCADGSDESVQLCGK